MKNYCEKSHCSNEKKWVYPPAKQRHITGIILDINPKKVLEITNEMLENPTPIQFIENKVNFVSIWQNQFFHYLEM